MYLDVVERTKMINVIPRPLLKIDLPLHFHPVKKVLFVNRYPQRNRRVHLLKKKLDHLQMISHQENRLVYPGQGPIRLNVNLNLLNLNQ